MVRTLTAFALLSLYSALYSQDLTIPISDCRDTLIVVGNDEGSLYLQWLVGQTTQLKTISFATNCHVDNLSSLNPIVHFRDIEPCDLILVPFDSKLLVISSSSATYPVLYKVKQGETIFGIARRMLHIPVDGLLRMNALEDYNLKTGQVLILGYLRTDSSTGIQTDLPLAESWLHHPGHVIDSQMINTSPTAHFATQKGVAWWNKSKADPNLFALHRKAPINSLIEIRNPMFRRSVWAKVIGTIPGTYADDISVIVSQGVARSLGAIDGRFYVEVSYEVR